MPVLRDERQQKRVDVEWVKGRIMMFPSLEFSVMPLFATFRFSKTLPQPIHYKPSPSTATLVAAKRELSVLEQENTKEGTLL